MEKINVNQHYTHHIHHTHTHTTRRSGKTPRRNLTYSGDGGVSRSKKFYPSAAFIGIRRARASQLNKHHTPHIPPPPRWVNNIIQFTLRCNVFAKRDYPITTPHHRHLSPSHTLIPIPPHTLLFIFFPSPLLHHPCASSMVVVRSRCQGKLH